MRSAFARVPRNPLYVALGLAISGAAVYAFLAVAGRALGPAAYAPLAALWALVFLLGPGLFGPLEQELARALGARRSAGVGSAPVIRRAALAGGALALLLAALTLALSAPLRDRLFDGDQWLVVGLALSLPGYALFYLARGILAGSARFDLYGSLLAGEGLVRLLAGVALVIGGAQAGGYGVVVGLAPYVALLLLWPARTEFSGEGPPAPWRELTSMLGWLLIGSVFTQILVNAGPVAVKWLAGPDQGEVAGRLLAGLLLTRVPLYLFQAVAAAMLPALSARVAAGDEQGFKTLLRQILLVAGGLSVVSVVGTAIAGPWALELFFGAEYRLARSDLVLLAAASGGVILGYTLGATLIALGRHSYAAWGWVVGTVLFTAVTALGSDLLLRVELGLVVGCLGAAAAMAALLLPTLTRRSWTRIES